MAIHIPTDNNVNSLVCLIHMCDPLLPIGGFTQSYGLETYVQKGIVCNAGTSKAYMESYLLNNFLYNDLPAAKLAWEYTEILNLEGVCRLDKLLCAAKISREIRTASVKLGNRFSKIVDTVLRDNDFLNSYKEKVRKTECAGHYSIILGISAKLFNIEKKALLTAMCYNTASSIINNCAKLVPISQKDGQEILFEAHHVIESIIKKADSLGEESIGTSCTGFDLRSMQHERLYTRLYIS